MIDTRKLTKSREDGSMLCKIEFPGRPVDFYDPNKENLSQYVAINEIQSYYGKNYKEFGAKYIYLIDCGNKNSILKKLLNFNVKVTVVPWNYNFLMDVHKFDGILFLN